MRFLLAPYGSRGDIEPMLALAVALRSRGHQVIFAAPPDYRCLAEEEELPFHPVGPPFRQFFEASRNQLRILHEVFKTIPDQFRSLRALVPGMDCVVGAMLQFALPTLAEAHNVTYFYAVFSPTYVRSARQPVLGIPLRQPPAWLHRWIWWLQDSLFPVMGGALNRERRTRGLPPVAALYSHLARPGSILGAFDPLLTPLPSDAEPVHTTGIWRRPCRGALPVHVGEFLDTGSPPLYVGFGSIYPQVPADLTRLVCSAAAQAGVRILLPEATAAGPEAFPGHCLPISDVPHELLFPRVHAVVHHGGAGTLGAAALAARPQAVVAHLGDQYYHGYRVQELGLGPAPLHGRHLSMTKLARLFAQLVEDTSYSVHAVHAAARMRANGSEQAAALLEGWLEAPGAEQDAAADAPRGRA